MTKKKGKGKSKATAKPAPTKWQVAVYEKASGEQPALRFLTEIPKEPRRELLKIITAVVQVGPLQFPTGRLGWHLMHKDKGRGRVDMSGIFEARDKHGQELYRVYCDLDGKAHEHGLSLPSLVLLGGAKKEVGTEVPQRTYRRIVNNRDDYRATRRVADSAEMPDWWPNG